MGAKAIVLVGAGLAVLASGCTSNHAALNPAGPRARHIADLMLLFVGVSTIVYLVVIAFLIWAMWRRRARAHLQGAQATRAAENKARRVIGAALALTVVVLITLALADFFVQRFLAAHPADALRVLVTGHQYWWEVEYDDPDPSQRLHTANEFHIPVGRPVELVLTSQDVIHSMWLPNLTGKKDLIPGHTNTEVLLADKPGEYSGQCAEFCGLQHAQMRLIVRAEPAAQFETWRQQQLAPARAPQSDAERRGQEVFVRSTCILCHTIQGTDASATVAPDLTHLASRGMLAAGTLPNTQGNLSSWILAPHRFKPGVQMPATALPPDELAALAAYLASLR
ncbi:MAG: cytochrome c oxidase, subunit [Gammaproteobacteria bacterium]|nr:cytochrome c oxidase, subunit [Gammaproteobacteria bacterium]